MIIRPEEILDARYLDLFDPHSVNDRKIATVTNSTCTYLGLNLPFKVTPCTHWQRLVTSSNRLVKIQFDLVFFVSLDFLFCKSKYRLSKYFTIFSFSSCDLCKSPEDTRHKEAKEQTRPFKRSKMQSSLALTSWVPVQSLQSSKLRGGAH